MRMEGSRLKSAIESRMAWMRNPMGRGDEVGSARKEEREILGSREIE
jgi:hypothetical protein